MAEKSRPVDVFAKIGRFWLYLFLFDCAATGSGRYFTIGPLTPRIVLAVLIVLSAAVPFFSDIENQIRRPVNWIVLIFMFPPVCGHIRLNQAKLLHFVRHTRPSNINAHGTFGLQNFGSGDGT